MVGELAFRASLPRTGTTSRDARHDLSAWLPERCGPSAAETALLLASELVTNAVVHTRSPDVGVSARCNGDTLRVAVDDDDAVPSGSGHACSGPTGTGLSLVDALAARWGWEPTSGGKRVWFEVPCARPDDAQQGAAGARRMRDA